MRLIAPALIAVFLFGCRDHETEMDAAVADTGPVGGNSANPDTGPVGAVGGSTVPRCEVDFPCYTKFQCVGAAQYRALHTIDCREVCGDRPCSGGMCKAVGDVIDCPDGQVCNNGDVTLNSECRPIIDGGLCKYLDDGGVDLPGCITPWGCGDGKMDRGEACDDHNRNDGDGCDHNCQVER